jgi:hypothetical protein
VEEIAGDGPAAPVAGNKSWRWSRPGAINRECDKLVIAGRVTPGGYYAPEVSIMAKGKRWNITTSGDRSLKDVKKEVKEAGFTVDEVHEEIGIITGAASDAVAKKLKAIPGVSDVSPEESVDIGPPDSTVTW